MLCAVILLNQRNGTGRSRTNRALKVWIVKVALAGHLPR